MQLSTFLQVDSSMKRRARRGTAQARVGVVPRCITLLIVLIAGWKNEYGKLRRLLLDFTW